MTTYVTFGTSHRHEIGGNVFDANCVAEIDSRTSQEGRDKAFEIFGRKWCFEYFNDLPDMEYFSRGLVRVGE